MRRFAFLSVLAALAFSLALACKPVTVVPIDDDEDAGDASPDAPDATDDG